MSICEIQGQWIVLRISYASSLLAVASLRDITSNTMELFSRVSFFSKWFKKLQGSPQGKHFTACVVQGLAQVFSKCSLNLLNQSGSEYL